MRLGRILRGGLHVALFGAVLHPACARRQPAEVNPIVPSFSMSRARAPLGSAVEVTYTWVAEAEAKKVPGDYRAMVHFLDTHRVMLFEDDHAPTPPTSQWEPGKTYTYTRTKFIPIYPYVGEVEVRMGLTPPSGRGERIALKGQDAGLREYQVAKIELLPQTENIFLVYKEGWHTPEASPDNPGLERTWTKKEALVSFKNPRKDIIVYIEADTNTKLVNQPQALTMSIGKTGLHRPVENSEVFLEKVRFKAADLGDAEWVDLRLSTNYSFVPKDLGFNQDWRELGLLVYHLYVAEADKLGPLPGVVDAGPVTPPLARPVAFASPAAGRAGSPAPARTASPSPARTASPSPRPSPTP